LGSTNWVSSGWQNIGPYGNAAVNQNGTLIQGTNPGFTNPATLDYSLATTSPAVGQAPALPSGFQPVLNMFKAPADGVARGTVNDLGAFEGSGTGSGPIVNPPPPVTTAPATPTGLTATPASATSVALSWTSVSNATSYNIQRRIGSGAFASLTTGVSGTSYTDNSAAASTTYGYQVNATNSAGTSSWSATVSTTTPASGGGTPPAPGQMPDYTGPLFPADNVWRAPVDTLPVDSHSAAYVGSIGSGVNFHPGFGTSYGGAPIGIPYNTVGAGQAKIPIAFEWSANGSYPIPPAPLIEGLNAWNDATDGDRHLLIVDTSTSKLYETWYTFGPGMPPASGSWSTYPPANPSSWWAGSGIVFDLTSDALPPDGDTSSDAAGLPVFPGLVRYDEVTAGQINHALRFTAQITRSAHVWPARHDASSNTSANVPPMGQRFRLKASVDISGYSAKNRVILTALKKYGCFLADNGGNWFFSGTHDDRWDDSDLNALKSLKGGDFEAVDISQWLNDPAFNVNSAAVPGGLPPDTTPPSRPANLAATVVSSTTVTLSWTASTDNTGGTGVAGYRVYRGTTLAGSPTGPSFQDTGLSPSMTYNYTVIAVDGAGNPSPASSVLTVVTASLNGTGGGATTSSVTLLETAAFPNPAVGKDPTIRAFVGDADELEITIYDAAGGVVHSDRVAGGPTGTGSDGRPYYDYVWTAKKASGVYYAIIHGKKGGAIVRGRVKFAVVK